MKGIPSSKLAKIPSYFNNVDPFSYFFNKITRCHRETVKKSIKIKYTVITNSYIEMKPIFILINFDTQVSLYEIQLPFIRDDISFSVFTKY